MKLQCGLLEPFTVNKSEISMSESRLMRSMNCIAQTNCNKYDKNKNYYASCEEAITARMDQPDPSDVYFNINLSDP